MEKGKRKRSGDDQVPKRKKALEAASNSKEMSVGQHNLNPLMIDLVLDSLFPYFKHSPQSLKDFRLVNRVWNEKAVKDLRKETEIKMSRLIHPFPEGLGWREEKGDGLSSSEPKWLYDCPYQVAPFENIIIDGSCNLLKDARVTRWFQLMGSTVKRIHFQSSFNCYHHTRFLECIMKLWCKNVTTLYLNGISWYTGFSHYSRFDNNPFICDLKEFIIKGVPEKDNKAGDCSPGLTESFLKFENDSLQKISVLDERLSLIGQIETIFQRILQEFGEEESGLQEAPGFAPRLGTDGGVLAHIMEHVGSEKIVIKDLPSEHCDAFLLSLTRKPKRLQETLKDLEYGNFPMFMWCWQLTSFQKLKFNLSRLSFGPFSFQMTSSNITSLLKSLSETLQHLEFDGNVLSEDWESNEDEYLTIKIPSLPHLKTFKNGNIFSTRTGPLDVVKKLPNLEKCSLTNAVNHNSIFSLDPPAVFNLLFQSSNFEAQETHQLKELILNGKISYGRHIELLRSWFPNLTKLEVTLDGAEVFVAFLEFMQESDLEDVKISFYSNDCDPCIVAICNHLRNFPKLRFLEVIHMSNYPFPISQSTCLEGFAKAPKLTSLKLENVSVFKADKKGIVKALYSMSCARFFNCTFKDQPTDLEFTVGVNDL